MPAYKDAATGKWYVQFWHTDYNGKKKKKMKRGFDRKGDALKWEAEYKLKMAGSPDMTFASLMEHYLDDCRHRMKETTMHRKETIARTHLLPVFGQMPLSAIDARVVRQWQNDLLKKNYKPSYLRVLHAQLSAAFNYGIRYYGLHSNPASKAGTIGTANPKRVDFLTVAEFYRAAEEIHDDEVKTIVTLLFWTGMRIGEAMALTQNDFDFANKTVTINKTKTKIQGKTLITAPKTEKSKRTVTLSDEPLEAITRYIGTLYDYKPTRELFTISRTTLFYKFRAALERAGLEQVRLHALRHSHAALLVEMGFPPILISERLGHENVTTTMNVYSHLYPNKQQDVADRLNNLKNGIKTESEG